MSMFRNRESFINTSSETSIDLSVNSNDAALVMASLGGDRDAFCEIVTRYQSLLCSLAYSSVGDFKHSEDIAQDTFVEAWKKLDTLRDPVKLKSWLCGILRFKVSHYRRKESNQPVQNAAELDEIGEVESDQLRVEDEAIQDQQQALLWQTLQQMPENYREPLILFYREQRSVENVAIELDLSEDTVKQRLSRGRKLLQKAMVTFVEDTLEKSKPGAAFTMVVMTSISSISPPVKASVFGAGVVKTGAVIKWAALLTILASLSGIVSSFFGVRSGLDQSRTQRERKNVIMYASLFISFAVIYVLVMFLLKYLALSDIHNAAIYAIVSQLIVLGFVVSYIILLVRMLNKTRELRAQERIFHPESFQSEKDQVDSKQREFKSRLSIAGIPLLHFRFGMTEKNDKPVVGWLAGGDVAYGLLFAWGGIAIAPISVGILSIGLITVGAIGLGLIGLGTVAIGVIGFGASAIAFKAYASLSAVGWSSAVSGGFSIANDAAIGSIVFANQTNNEQAAEIANLTTFGQNYTWALLFIAVFVIIPAVWHSNLVRKRMGKK